jgi:hypothetical protein
VARDRPTSEALFRYADLRMERLVKVTRSVVGEILDGRAEECYPLLEPIRLYADLLAQALVEGRVATVQPGLNDLRNACRATAERAAGYPQAFPW